MKKMQEKGICLLGSILTVLGLGYRLDYGDIYSIFDGYSYSIFPIIILPLLYYFFMNNINRVSIICEKKRGKICTILPSFFFAAFMILGYSFQKEGSLNLLLASWVQIVKSMQLFVSYTFFFFQCIVFIYYQIDHFEVRENKMVKSGSRILAWLNEKWDRHPFLFVLVVLLIAYLPVMLLSYPATFMGDTSSQIQQGFNIPEWTTETQNRISDSVYLNNHHPVAHTMLIHIFLLLGQGVFKSYNVGIFLYASLQALVVMIIVSYALKRLYLDGIKKSILFCIILYYILSPRIQNYMYAITKDVYYSAFLLLFSVTLYELVKNRGNRINSILFIIASLGMLLFRNEGLYTILFVLAVCFLLIKQRRKKIIIIAIGLFMFSFLYQNVLFPTLQITPSSTREMLSLPFQQTARYVKNYEGELTEEEKETIGKVLDVDHIGELYDALSADPVKATYNKYATKDELKDYFSVWFSMLTKHPLVYIEATMNQKFHHFYPGTEQMDFIYCDTSEFLMECTNKNCAPTVITDFHYPLGTQTIRKAYEGLRENIWHLPILATLLSSAAYTWTIFLLFFYGVYRANRIAICALIPQVMQLAVSMLGPENGLYSRYVLPFILCIVPITFLCLLTISEKEGELL